MYAVIGGSGLSRLANIEVVSRKVCRTPYGEPSGPLTFGRIQGRDVLFLARHGYGHSIAPHEVNYRANIWALKEEGAQRIVSVASVGGIGACGERMVKGAVYATTQGPRLETAAEIARIERDGADIVGMTGMPEAVLARELDVEYAAIGVIANFAAGKGDSKESIALDAIEAVLREAMERVHRIIERLVLT